MQMTFRWFGPDDPVRLEQIRQVPGVEGIVAALYHLEPGVVWTRDEIRRLRESIEGAGLRFAVVESVPVHEDIKLGRPTRDALLNNYCQSIENIGAEGVPVVCYNFMPVFDWTRTRLDQPMPDGSTTVAYDHEELARIDPFAEAALLPAWYVPAAGDLPGLLKAYEEVPAERLWENLGYFLERVIPVAESAGVRMAMHPDDPPWSVFGLPRIITDGAALERMVGLVDSPANGVTFCTGSLGASPDNDLPTMIRRVGSRINFVHCRNVRITGHRSFIETAHPSRWGSVDFRAVMEALKEVGFEGPLRPDHGRMIWGETGKPGYGLFDRALGATYLQGLWEAVPSPVGALS